MLGLEFLCFPWLCAARPLEPTASMPRADIIRRRLEGERMHIEATRPPTFAMGHRGDRINITRPPRYTR